MDTDLPLFKKIWLTDDVNDDCELFEDVLKNIMPGSSLTIIPNGELLMNMLTPATTPDMLF